MLASTGHDRGGPPSTQRSSSFGLTRPSFQRGPDPDAGSRFLGPPERTEQHRAARTGIWVRLGCGQTPPPGQERGRSVSLGATCGSRQNPCASIPKGTLNKLRKFRGNEGTPERRYKSDEGCAAHGARVLDSSSGSRRRGARPQSPPVRHRAHRAARSRLKVPLGCRHPSPPSHGR
jgi:hypothetical protein